MQIKKFRAASLKEAAEIMKSELGTEALILGTKVVADENDNRLKLYEITAGVDKFEIAEETKSKVIKQNLSQSNSFADEMRNMTARIYQQNQNQKQKINSAYGLTEKIGKEIIVKKESAAVKENSADENRMKEIIKNLSDKEVQKSVVLSVMEQLKKYKNFLSKDNLDNYVQTVLGSLIQTKSLDLNVKKQNKVIALVGPTGVGKTTTIAKLALIAKIIHKLDVGLISIDTYRLGAIDQLKSFADVSHTDFLVAYEPEEMPALMKKFAKKDIVFIDTVGRNHKNDAQLKSNLDFLSSVKIDETFLVLSAASSTRNLVEIAKKFKMFNYSSFIISKIDEAVVHGNIINLSTKTGSPIAFLTNGQTIPDDIISADKDYIANLIYTSQLRS
ncbi:MAG TPA: flagellar biosynthesis protein FlhF [Ignavibacteriaceae bacterium]|nr:flagellar biosynthesis protein FlhF [Ignavibacterium sp.]HRN25673.1 flagellar biosynthesis protein FlhF [Ignavibacteriaceae bacterium]HRP91725.1 flagellar biosynthesis protein FlhF [Ignavibacteriaceae bacterium]HRQ53305.1 flagellar biosynthesis protein FlhF [Ignavibacteriaceae bacterium]